MTTSKKFQDFQKEHGAEDFKSLKIAQEYATLKMEWWGGNLVFLGIQEENGVFNPGFNVFD